MRYSIFIVFLFLQNIIAFSQTGDTTTYYFEGFHAHYGFIIPHTEKVEPVSHTRPYGIEISLNRLRTSYESWKVFNHYNISGVQLSYFNFQNPGIVGSAFALTIFTEPILSKGEKWLFSIKAGTGLSYQTRLYDPDKNPLNTFFSTRISFPLYLMARFKYRLNGNFYLTLSGSYNHISNGAINIPNCGINFPTLLFGIEHFQKPLPKLENVYKPSRNKNISNRYLIIQTLTGYKIVYGERVYAAGLHSRFTWQIRTHYSLNAGAEIILDGGVRRMIEIENRKLDYKRAAITAGQDLLFGKVSFTQYVGYYVYTPYKARNSIYQKYELSYRIHPEIMVGVFLKAHSSDAELAGLTLSYIIRYK